MKIGFIGLGKMGFHMVAKLVNKKQHTVIAFDRSSEQIKAIEKKGAKGVSSLKELTSSLKSPRVIWIMIPHQAVDDTIKELIPLLNKGDILIDGGNSKYTESIRRSNELSKKGIIYMDIGVSGGLAASKTGYCMMVGGDKNAYKKIIPLIKTMCVPNGFGHFGPSGSGHYVKMVHNAIEYGMMQAIGEGLDLIKSGPFPNTNQIELTDVWNHGSIIRSFLMEMTANGLKKHPGMNDVDGFIPNSGEGAWAVEDAKKYNTSIPVIETSLDVRMKSDKVKNYGTKVVAVMRDEFGGHGVKKK